MLKLAEIVKIVSLKLKTIIVDYVTRAKTLQSKKNKKIDSLIHRLNIKDKDLDLPYSIIKGMMNGKFDVRYNGKKLNDWNLALKFLLIDCKHLIMLQNLIDGCETTYNFKILKQSVKPKVSPKKEDGVKQTVEKKEEMQEGA
jgi:hypothetical protein